MQAPRSKAAAGVRRAAPAFLLAALFIAGCGGQGARYAARADQAGLVRTERTGLPFRHAVFARATSAAATDLHVYLEGDGTPWRRPGVVATDPTPRAPLALELLARDPGPAVLVGRPCYHAAEVDPACDPRWWTARRYAPEIVASLAKVIEDEAEARGARRLTLIGHSGGGVLAVLLAARLPRVTLVVTLAANLDVAAWTTYHGYPPLAESLDPAREPPRRAPPAQFHYLGELDTNVPPRVLESLRSRSPAATWRVVPGFDHHCCWVERWPALLAAATGEAAGN